MLGVPVLSDTLPGKPAAQHHGPLWVTLGCLQETPKQSSGPTVPYLEPLSPSGPRQPELLQHEFSHVSVDLHFVVNVFTTNKTFPHSYTHTFKHTNICGHIYIYTSCHTMPYLPYEVMGSGIWPLKAGQLNWLSGETAAAPHGTADVGLSMRGTQWMHMHIY